MSQEKPETCQNPCPLVLRKLPETRRTYGFSIGVTTIPRGISMSFVKCSVDGCSKRLQPILKVDPKDRDTWFYRECDVCLKPACEKHSAEVERRLICDRCRREAGAEQQSTGLIDLSIRLPPRPK
jgi:hypothetical protein